VNDVGNDPPSAADQARETLREEVERFRSSVEQMLDQPQSRGDVPAGRVGQLEARLLRLEGRIDQIEQERRFAEWRMYSNVERLLDDVLRDIRAIADRLTRLG
jgi:hypothetical protein